MKREILLVFVLLSFAQLVFGAPVISSVVIEPDPLVVGQDFRVKVMGQNISSGVVYLDFRPQITRLLRFNLTVGTDGISAAGTIPSDLGITGDVQCTLRVYALDSASVQTTTTKTVTVKPPLVAPKISFDKPAYSTSAGTPLEAKILIQGVPAGGLFSYALEVDVVGQSTAGSSLSIAVPPALNFNGPRAGGALARAVGDKAFAKGTINLLAQPITYYTEPLLATLTVVDLPAGVYSLVLKGYPTLGPTETLFVNSVPASFDSAITYVASSLMVVPGPAKLTSKVESPAVAPAVVIPGTASTHLGGGAPLNVSSSGVELAVSVLPSGSVSLSFLTAAGVLYAVQYSEDGVRWVTVPPVLTGTGFIVHWTDPTVSDVPHQHYRAVPVESEDGP